MSTVTVVILVGLFWLLMVLSGVNRCHFWRIFIMICPCYVSVCVGEYVGECVSVVVFFKLILLGILSNKQTNQQTKSSYTIHHHMFQLTNQPQKCV
jgi:hypothetical protein